MRALVIGFGISGQGAAKLLLKQGYEVLAIDREPRIVGEIEVFPEDAPIYRIDLTVLSSGIPRNHPQAKGNVIGEAELALRYLKNRIIGITGTNGKTTLTLLITHVLNKVGIPARALGNVGISLAEYACNPKPKETLVVELSSYQLETMETKAFDLGIITNITPDHLDRYPSFEAYAKAKYRLKDLIKEGGVCIEGDSYLQLTENERYWKLIGHDTVKNAWVICQRLGVKLKEFNQALESFEKPPHRMEFVGIINGVRWINDSKGTNVDSVLYGILQLSGPIFLIAGGKSKGTSFKEWKKGFSGRVKGIFAIGETAKQIEEELEDDFPIWQCGTLEVAVEKARELALYGDTVLLSPGCASFDQFRDYKERGEKFREYISNIGNTR